MNPQEFNHGLVFILFWKKKLNYGLNFSNPASKEVLYFEPKKEFYEGICELYSWIKETEFE